jgi:DNA-directed RNA polymerase subunit RPC12/RpoP
MRTITLTFVCGHTLSIDDGKTLPDAVCPSCGERRVRAVSAPKPTVRAVGCDVKSPLLVKE